MSFEVRRFALEDSILGVLSTMNEMRLFDLAGNRLYLNADERRSFMAASRQARPEVRTFCETLHYTGCRISEALEITPKRVDLSAGQITLPQPQEAS